jgi:hypothetical protein
VQRYRLGVLERECQPEHGNNGKQYQVNEKLHDSTPAGI